MATKSNGMRLSQSDFTSLRKGDLYYSTYTNTVKVFDHPSKKQPYVAINSERKQNELANMRWCTQEELDLYRYPSTPSRVATPPRPHPLEDVVKCAKFDVRKEETKMSAMSRCGSVVSDALCVVKEDTVDAAWRTAAKQTVKSAKVPLGAFLCRQKLPKGVVGFLASQLSTESGEAVLALVLGTGLTYVPQFGCDPKFVRLSKELRVLGMEVFTSKVADVVLNPMREYLADLIGGLPLTTVE